MTVRSRTSLLPSLSGMRRLLSQSRSSRFSFNGQTPEKNQEKAPLHDADASDDADTTTTTTAQPPAPLAPPNLKVKRVDHYWSTWAKSWKYRTTGSGVVAEAVRPVGNGTDSDPWEKFCFVVVRKFPDPNRQAKEGDFTFQIVLKSPYLLKACKDVIGQVPGISWTAEPLEVLSPSAPHISLADLSRALA